MAVHFSWLIEFIYGTSVASEMFEIKAFHRDMKIYIELFNRSSNHSDVLIGFYLVLGKRIITVKEKESN